MNLCFYTYTKTYTNRRGVIDSPSLDIVTGHLWLQCSHSLHHPMSFLITSPTIDKAFPFQQLLFP